MESMPLSMMKHLEDDVPPVFMILDTYDKDIKVVFCIEVHTYLTISYLFLQSLESVKCSVSSFTCKKNPH